MRICTKCGAVVASGSVCGYCGSTSTFETGNNADTSVINREKFNRPVNTNLTNRPAIPGMPRSRVQKPNTSVPKPNVVVPKPRTTAPRVGAAVPSPLVPRTASASAVAPKKNSAGAIAAIVIGALAAVIAIVIGVFAIVNATNTTGPEQTIEQLEYSLNEMDIKGALDCFDSKLSGLYNAGNSIMKGIVGFGYDGIVDLAPALLHMSGEGENLPEFNFVIEDTQYYGKKQCMMRVEIYENGQYMDEETIELKKIKGEWKISSDELLMELGSSLGITDILD